MSWSRAVLVAALCAVTAACGFKLRGQQDLPFETISVPGATPLATDLRRNIAASGGGTRVVDSVTDADAVLSILAEQQEKVILSLNTEGRVREFQLRYRVVYRLSSPKGLDYIPATSAILTRDITFNDQVLAKEAEEALLYREMRADVVQQIIRRLGRIKTVPAAEDE